MLKLLPLDYGLRNLSRRGWRTGLTLAALATVILLVLIVVGFIRGLESSLRQTGSPRSVLVYALGMAENLEYSAVPASTADLLAASLPGVQRRYGMTYVSPELYLATRVAVGQTEPATGLVRGVTPATLLVRWQVEITAGHWPEPGEILVGRLAAAKLGATAADLAIGRSVRLEGREFRVAGQFAAAGSVLESEIWCRLDDFQRALRRQDLSLVALTLAPGADFTDIDLFCKERLDLQLQASRETDYYASLVKHYRPVRLLGWLVVGLVAAAGLFAALNTMYAAVVGRIRELAALQTIGFSRRAIVVSLVEEGLLLSMAGAVLAGAIAVVAVHGAAIRFTMGAFRLEIDGPALLAGCATALVLGIAGGLAPAWRALRMPLVDALRAT